MSAPSPLPSRAERLARLEEHPPEVLVVGGGITGAGVALDLATRGVRTVLVERGDWAERTSSASSRLVHGGLRYLEYGELGLVRESCLERALLLRNAAGLVWPERFLFPVRRGDRVGLAKMAAGLLLYTAVSVPRALGLPRVVSRRRCAQLVPGIDSAGLRGAGSYLDAATDDARLTLAAVLTAAEAGAVVLSRTECVSVERGERGAAVELLDRLEGARREVRCRAVVLCGGPEVEELRRRAGLSGSWVSPTRGAHVLVPRERLPTDGAVVFPSAVDGRVMFLIPWPRFTVIGTTDVDAELGPPPRATRAEVAYLLESAGALVPGAELTEDDVVSTYAGRRPLLAAPGEDPSARSREERVAAEGPVWTIAGGKLTTFRAMAEKLCARLCAETGLGDAARHSDTRTLRLRGALPARVERPTWSDPLRGGAGDPVANAWRQRYAGLRSEVEDACRRAPEGFAPLDEETLLGEVDWAVHQEDCLGLDDFFLRRTDLGLGPRETAVAAAKLAEERMAALLAWDADARARARADLDAALDRAHGWRDEPR